MGGFIMIVKLESKPTMNYELQQWWQKISFAVRNTTNHQRHRISIVVTAVNIIVGGQQGKKSSVKYLFNCELWERKGIL